MINLYYDKIIDNTPIPNGALKYTFSKDFKRLPIVSDANSPIMPITAFYNAMKATGTTVNLYSGSNTVANLFYPFELGLGRSWNVPLINYIPTKTVSRIKKGKMKLLILAPRIAYDYSLLWKLRSRLDYLEINGIHRSQICIVLGDLNQTYKRLFDNPNVYGFDWWQVHAQIAYKSRYGLEDLHWVFRDTASSPLNKQDIEAEDFNIENWNPTRIFTAYTGNTQLHDTSLVSEIIHRQLDTCGIYAFNIVDEIPAHNYKDFRIVDKSKGEEYIEAKREIIKKLHTTIRKIDFDYTTSNKDPLKINKKLFEDSVINIVSEGYTPKFDQHYLDEINVISPSLKVWRQIAKGHPFMVLGCLNTLGYISNEGYFGQTTLIDQRYDKISSTVEKVNMLCNNIEMLNSYSTTELQEKMHETIPFLKKNQEKFFKKPNKRKFEALFREMKYE
tara:strand:- start:4469 stop:5803 length:1335 start_codon:yes stop_codon:yes gene_type:complete